MYLDLAIAAHTLQRELVVLSQADLAAHHLIWHILKFDVGNDNRIIEGRHRC